MTNYEGKQRWDQTATMSQVVILLAILMILGVVIPHSAQNPPKACRDECLTEIQGLGSSYVSGSLVTFSIHNRSTRDVNVNVTVEARYPDSWREILISISDSQHPFGKSLKLTRLKAGRSISLSYDPWNGPVKEVYAPNLQRLRVDESVDVKPMIEQQLWSEPFELLASKESK